MLDPGESNASARGFVDEAERYVPVEIPVNRGEVGKRRRLGEELEGQPVTGIVGVEQVAREGEQAPTVLGPPIRVDRVVFFGPRCGFWVLERRKIGGNADLAAAQFAADVLRRVPSAPGTRDAAHRNPARWRSCRSRTGSARSGRSRRHRRV